MHQPYEELLHHPHDFVVRYRFYTQEEGGRDWPPPRQGLRLDFRYADQAQHGTATWMIWPEFEDESGAVMLDNELPVPMQGTARMWIINAENRHKHLDRIRVGTRGYFVEGPHALAACEVIDMVGLLTNPRPLRPLEPPKPPTAAKRRQGRA